MLEKPKNFRFFQKPRISRKKVQHLCWTEANGKLSCLDDLYIALVAILQLALAGCWRFAHWMLTGGDNQFIDWDAIQ